MEETTAPLKNLPSDVFFEILLRLPTRTLVRFLSVCKSWYALVRNPTFIATYSTISRPEDRSLLCFNPDNGSVSIISANNLKLYGNYEFPFAFSYIECHGLCKGLVCLTVVKNRNSSGTYLYNPILRKLKRLEYFRTGSQGIQNNLYGFGHDERSNDHRVVRIALEGTKTKSELVKVYSLKSHSWQSIVERPPERCIKSTSFCFNGVAHWLTQKGSTNISLESILSFDFSKNVFVDLPLPKALQCFSCNKGRLFGLQGSLAFLFNSVRNTVRYSVWMMKEYGVSESWAEQFTFFMPQAWPQFYCFGNGTALLNVIGSNYAVRCRCRSHQRGKCKEQCEKESQLVTSTVLYDIASGKTEDLGHFIYRIDTMQEFAMSLLLLDCKDPFLMTSPKKRKRGPY